MVSQNPAFPRMPALWPAEWIKTDCPICGLRDEIFPCPFAPPFADNLQYLSFTYS
jgi:hypothetical protein